jgi:gamma-polyglutamate biosynthesis protein CapA
MNRISCNKTCRMIFAGDLLPADRDHTAGIGAGTRLARGEELWTSEISALFRQGDVNLINLEAPMVEDPQKIGRNAFAGSPKILQHVSDSGITHAHIANNHILEHGKKQFDRTICLLKRAGIEPVGLQKDGKCKINVIELKGLRLAMAGFNAIHDIPDPEGCYSPLTEQSVMAVLGEEAMEKADIRVLSFHWGNEYVHIPSWDQIQLARKAIDSGAHLIIGHHPHVIQPLEAYKDGLICYSLGNFVFDMLWNRVVSTGLIVDVTKEKGAGIRWNVHWTRIHARRPVSFLLNGWARRRLEQYKETMGLLLKQGETTYRKIYSRKVKVARLVARLQMKRQLLFQLVFIPRKHRQEIIQSVVSRTLSKFGT